MSNPKLVRVKDPDTGTEYTTGAVNAKNKGMTAIDKPAVDGFGRALPAKRRNPQQADTSTKSTRGSANTNKEA